MNNNIFISVGRTVTPEQEAFVQAIEETLKANGLVPRAVGRSDFSSQHPLKFIQQLMRECSGTVIIAFERVKVIDGTDRRGSPQEQRIANQILPTVWNQIEAAMAYVLGHPLLVVVEDGSRSEGLLEAGYDWYVQRVPLAPESVRTREFTGVFNDWKKRVETATSQKRLVDVSSLTAKDIINSMKPSHLKAVIAAVIAVIGAVFYLGKMTAEWQPKEGKTPNGGNATSLHSPP